MSRQANLPTTEPVILPTVYLTDIEVVDAGHIIYFTGYERIVDDGGEKRMQMRFVMTVDRARAFLHELARALPGMGN